MAQPLNVTPTSRNQGVIGDKRVIGDKPQPVPSTSGKEIADNIIIDAERFKASVQPPKGRSLNIQRLLEYMDDDDEFFHVTCHIDPSLKAKIERGEFVDLERLLPKDKLCSGGNIAYESESKVELVSHAGHTYFKPVRDRDAQITGLRKWEQAFRVYAAIYTVANPERSGEIWQYMHVINVAASAYHWDNVAYYDLTFRQLMAYKPNRSWAKTYNQGWNLAMRDPLIKATPSSNFGGRNNNNGSGKKDWRDDCCWQYNRNRCKNGSSCHFDHRCTYCGGWNHGYYNCRKRLGKATTSHGHKSGGNGEGSSSNNKKRNH